MEPFEDEKKRGKGFFSQGGASLTLGLGWVAPLGQDSGGGMVLKPSQANHVPWVVPCRLLTI
jgi:hypothetical protein